MPYTEYPENNGTQSRPLPEGYDFLLEGVEPGRQQMLRSQILEALGLDTDGRPSKILIGDKRVETNRWILVGNDKKMITDKGYCMCGAPSYPYDQVCSYCGNPKQIYHTRQHNLTFTTNDNQNSSAVSSPGYMEAHLRGGGAIAQGNNTIAVGKDGTYVAGDSKIGNLDKANISNRAGVEDEGTPLTSFEVENASADEWIRLLESQGYTLGSGQPDGDNNDGGQARLRIIKHLKMYESDLRKVEGETSVVVQVRVSDLLPSVEPTYEQIVAAARDRGMRPLTLGEAVTLRLKLGKLPNLTQKYIALKQPMAGFFGKYNGIFLIDDLNRENRPSLHSLRHFVVGNNRTFPRDAEIVFCRAKNTAARVASPGSQAA